MSLWRPGSEISLDIPPLPLDQCGSSQLVPNWLGCGLKGGRLFADCLPRLSVRLMSLTLLGAFFAVMQLAFMMFFATRFAGVSISHIGLGRQSA